MPMGVDGEYLMACVPSLFSEQNFDQELHDEGIAKMGLTPPQYVPITVSIPMFYTPKALRAVRTI